MDDAKPAIAIVDEGSMTDVREEKGKTYLFVGARYRGTVVPQAFMNLFAGGGRTVWNNSVAIELDIRKNGFSVIPAIMFAEHGMQDTLFIDKGKDPSDTANWSVIASNLKAIYATVDLLWSVQLHKMLDFEFGGGVGLGFLFGDLNVNWVTDKPTVQGLPGPYTADNPTTKQPMTFFACRTEADDSPQPAGTATGCPRTSHSNAAVAKVYSNGHPYVMPYWSDGGPVPNVFFHLAIPQIGLRIKPIKSVVARITAGFSIMGPFFGLSVYYGLERPKK